MRKAEAGPYESFTPSTPGERPYYLSVETNAERSVYEEYVPVAGDLYDEYLEELRKEGLIE